MNLCIRGKVYASGKYVDCSKQHADVIYSLFDATHTPCRRVGKVLLTNTGLLKVVNIKHIYHLFIAYFFWKGRKSKKWT